MIARALADLMLVLHLAFIVFVVGGGLLVLRWPRLAWAHVPAFLWGAAIELTGGICPLTPLEVSLRQHAGDAGYSGGFIEHYVAGTIYPGGLSRTMQVVMGLTVLTINGLVYLRLWRRRGTETRPAPLP